MKFEMLTEIRYFRKNSKQNLLHCNIFIYEQLLLNIKWKDIKYNYLGYERKIK